MFRIGSRREALPFGPLSRVRVSTPMVPKGSEYLFRRGYRTSRLSGEEVFPCAGTQHLPLRQGQCFFCGEETTPLRVVRVRGDTVLGAIWESYADRLGVVRNLKEVVCK